MNSISEEIIDDLFYMSYAILIDRITDRIIPV
jgi:hypothetical protein